MNDLFTDPPAGWAGRISWILLMVCYAGFLVLVSGRFFRPGKAVALQRADGSAVPR